MPELVRSLLLRLRPFRDYLDDGWALIGTPDEVREGLQGYLEATGYRRVLLLMALPGLEAAPGAALDAPVRDEVAPALTAVAHQ